MNSRILKTLRTFMLVAGIVALLASCKKDDIAVAEYGTLRIDVTAAGFTSGNGEVRAGESNYTTTFTGGDKIGITVIRTEGSVTTILENNVSYEYDGSSWSPTNMAVHRYPQAGIAYLAYYPYSTTMDGMKSADEIFAAFTPKSDQSSYADYTASDLMTGTGVLSDRSLSITLNHALSLVEMNLFVGSSAVTLKVDGGDFTPYNIGGATWRCIVKPVQRVVAMSGEYDLMGVLQRWQKPDGTLTAGSYAQVNVINSFYTESVNVNYADGTSETAQYDISIGGIVVRASEVIESIELPDAGGITYLIGRSTSGVLYLKIHGNGNLLLRPAGSDGYIPIGSYAELQLINTVANALNNNYRQEADLDLMNEPWMPVGSNGAPFAGIYNGDGHTIANLAIEMEANDNIGLFGVVDGIAPQITDLHIISGSIKGNANVGGICGRSRYTAITLCSNAATVEGLSDNVGGIAGLNDLGNIVASGNTGTIVGGNCVGGITGNSNGGVVAGFNGGTVTGVDSVGGIVGINNTGSINSCYNTNTITGESCVGGVVGMNSGPVAGDDPGDIPDMEDAGIVVACYNTGIVTGTNFIAGVSGLNAGQVMACYWLSGATAAGVNNSLDNPDLPGIDTDVTDFTLPPGFIPDDVTYSSWGIGDGNEGIANWKNYDGNGGLPQLWWEN